MLDTMRRHSRSTIIYVLFGIIIIAFVFTFNTGGAKKQCGSEGSVTLATVNGFDIDSNIFNMGLVLSPFEYNPTATDPYNLKRNEYYKQTRFPLANPDPKFAYFTFDPEEISPLKTEKVMNYLVETYLVSDVGKKLGLYATPHEIAVRIYTDDFYDPETKKFRDKAFNNYVYNRLQVTKQIYEDFIAREIIREKLIALMTAKIEAPEDEINFYLNEQKKQVNLKYIEIDPDKIADKIDIPESEITSYLQKNSKKVKDYYDKNKDLYKTEEKFSFKGIFVNKKEKKEENDKLLGELKAIAQNLRNLLASDTQKFNEELDRLIKEKSDIKEFKAVYTASEIMGYADGKEVIDTLKKAKDGSVSDPVSGKQGYWIIYKISYVPSKYKSFEEVKKGIAKTFLFKDNKDKYIKLLVADIKKHLQDKNIKTLEDALEFLRKKYGSGFSINETGKFEKLNIYSIGFTSDMLGAIPNIGKSKVLFKDAFKLTKENPFPKKLYKNDLTNRYYIVALKEITTTPDEDLKKQKKFIKQILDMKYKKMYYLAWYKDLRKKAEKNGDLSFTESYISYLNQEKAKFEQLLKSKKGTAQKINIQ